MKVSRKVGETIGRMNAGVLFGYGALDLNPEEFTAAAKAVERLVFKKVIKRVAAGKFYKPEQSVFGELPLPSEEILKPYLFVNGKRIAYITGDAVYCSLGLTTQQPKVVRIASKSRVTVNRQGVIARPAKCYAEVSEENYRLLQLLDAMKDFCKIPDLDKIWGFRRISALVAGLSATERSSIIAIALQYPPRVRAFLGAACEYSGFGMVTAPLKDSLNPFSSYTMGFSESIPCTSNWNIQ